MAIFLKRDTKVYLRKIISGTTVIWEIPVLDGFSFSQANTTSEVTLNEMESATGFSKRGRRAFNDALAPAEWSMSTYVRPFTSAVAYSGSATAGTGAGGVGNVFAVEEQLWANFVGKGGWTTSATGVGTVTASGLGMTFTSPTTTYEIDQGEYTLNGTSGFGATFRVEVTSATAANVTVINPGSGYATSTADHVITIPGSAIGGTGSLTVTITGLTTTEGASYDSESENFTRGTTGLGISFAGSGVGTLGTFDLFFVMGATTATSLNYTAGSTLEIFRLSNCVVNEATVNFEVDGISMIDWSGNASTLATEATFDARAAITEGITLTNNFIRNKITALSLTSNPGVTRLAYGGSTTGSPVAITALVTGRAYEITVAGSGNWTAIGASAATAGTRFIYNGVTGSGAGTPTATELAGSYNITLTGGSITFSNNVSYLTPETLGIVNQPIGHITGNKSVSGNFTAYVDFGLTNDSGALFDGATSTAARTIVTNSFALTFKIGGTVTNTPRLEIALPTAHLEIPTIQTEDVIAIDVAFSGLPSSITNNDEANLTYRAVT
jgi:hypothetical protein